MNTHYISIVTDYIDLTDCDFRYTLAWYRDNGFDLPIDEMLKCNLNAPASMLATWNPSGNIIDFLHYFKTWRQLEWILSHWEKYFWMWIVMNDFISTPMWHAVLDVYTPSSDEAFDAADQNTRFPWSRVFSSCIPINLVVGNSHIIDSEKSPDNNDWFWDDNSKRCLLTLDDYRRLSSNQSLSVSFWKRHLNEFDIVYASNRTDNVLDEAFWRFVVQNSPNTVDWVALANVFCLSDNFWNEFMTRVPQDPENQSRFWGSLADYNRVLSASFWIEHKSMIQQYTLLQKLCCNEYVPKELWEVYIQNNYSLDLRYLSYNTRLPHSFWKRHHKKIHFTEETTVMFANLPLECWTENNIDIVLALFGKEPLGVKWLYTNPFTVHQVMKNEITCFLKQT